MKKDLIIETNMDAEDELTFEEVLEAIKNDEFSKEELTELRELFYNRTNN